MGGPGPWATVGVGLGLSAAWLAVLLAFSALLGGELGSFPRARWSDWRFETVWALLVGMAPTVMAFTLRGAVRDVRDLAPALRADAEACAALQWRVAKPPRAILRAVGGVAIVTTVAIMAPDSRYWVGERPTPADPAFVWLVGRNAFNWWLIARALALQLVVARRISDLGGRLVDVDLLERERLALFGRHGLRSVLLWMILVSFFAPLYALGGADPVLGASLALVVALAAVAFLVPVWGAHRRLRDARVAALARVRARIAEQRDAVLDDALGSRDGRLADLLAWEARLEGTSEWPFGRTTVLRLALYTAIGLGSWVGAAAVERALGRLLG